LFTLAFINIIAALYSISYYLPQLSSVPPLFWFFTIDCPFYAFLFGINLILLALGKSNKFLAFISITGSIKYGLWTIFILYTHGVFFSQFFFIFTHLLLILEIFLFFKLFGFEFKHLIFGLSWFLFNDFLDYFVGIHPFFNTAFFIEVALFSVFSTIFISFFVFHFFNKKPNFAIFKKANVFKPKSN